MSKPIVKPYNTERSKKEEVAEMFNSISSRYDFLNHFLSLGIDHIWRRKAIRELKSLQPKRILDLATGTGDFAIAALRLNPTKIVGMDISKGMLSMGEIKMKKRGFDQVIEMKLGDSEALPFENDSFDAITVGFGVRNFENLTLGLSEMLRVTRKDGKIIILEFSKPKKFPVKQAFYLYSKYFIPFFGKHISKDAKAYSYLPESVAAFPEGEEFKNILSQIGYRNVQSKLVSGGIATIYIAEK
jgi:demethylmenaquinone methyltransferase/2-methoxy-6-polyprenyl-1,4-benzoquinol methylase